MATRSLVPRNSGEGSVGKVAKSWATGVFDNLVINGQNININQGLLNTDSVEFTSGNFTDGLTIGGIDVATVTGKIDRILEDATEFACFSNALDNNGVIEKVFYDSPNFNIHLSGIKVASADNIKLYLQWDGPPREYHGSASINGIDIPTENIIELGTGTRRFEGFLDNLNLAGLTEVSGQANGRSVLLPIEELGAGPSPINILIDSIENATPKSGEMLGETHLKEGDTINIYVDFDTDDIESIKVHNYGLAKEIDYTPYELIDLSGTYRATIPIEVSDREGTLSVAIQAKNNFGSVGQLKESSDFIHSSGTRNLDQLYPNILSTDPISYNGRLDGLRSGESVVFNNNISNWINGIDMVEYQSLFNDILINNPTEYETLKTVSYLSGIYSNKENLQIQAIRKSNGATDKDFAKIKIANGPRIVSTQLNSTASSSTAPHQIGVSQIKHGDIVDAKIEIDTQGSDVEFISVSVLDLGISDGSQTDFTLNYEKTELPNGNYEFLIPINVYGPIGNSSRDGNQPATFVLKNNLEILSDEITTSGTAQVNNSTIPSIVVQDINYPSGQLAIKSGEFAQIEHTINNFDTVLYSSNNQLNISNTTIYETSKIASYLSGDYNVDIDAGINNFKISATYSPNGITKENNTIVNIANTPLTISINNLQPIQSSPTINKKIFDLSTNQVMLNTPVLSLDDNQQNQPALSIVSSGTGKSSNFYEIGVSDDNTKGEFQWKVSAKNLANIETTTIETNSNYTLEGFTPRSIYATPTSIGAGLAPIGTSVSNPEYVILENLSEGGAAENGGTIYTYQSYIDGLQLDNSFDLDNKFTVCDSNGITKSNGNYIYNLDQLNRAANSSTSNPATFIVSE